MVLNIPQYIVQPPTTKNYSFQNATSARVEEPHSKDLVKWVIVEDAFILLEY